MNKLFIVATSALLFTACGSTDTTETPTDGEPTETENITETSEETSSTTSGYTYVADPGNITDLQAYVAEQFAKAKAADEKPFVYFTAGWCPPCQNIKKYKDDAQMVDAYQGMYIIEVDYDKFSDKANELYLATAIPHWSGLNEDGSTNYHVIDGGAWGENIPENMAPVLKEYFNGEPEAIPDFLLEAWEEEEAG